MATSFSVLDADASPRAVLPSSRGKATFAAGANAVHGPAVGFSRPKAGWLAGAQADEADSRRRTQPRRWGRWAAARVQGQRDHDSTRLLAAAGGWRAASADRKTSTFRGRICGAGGRAWLAYAGDSTQRSGKNPFVGRPPVEPEAALGGGCVEDAPSNTGRPSSRVPSSPSGRAWISRSTPVSWPFRLWCWHCCCLNRKRAAAESAFDRGRLPGDQRPSRLGRA